jgi:carbon monoxide dehydrogenase subunit G
VKLEQSFEVKAPIEQVWTALIDLEKVAPCLPGAAITGHDDDGTYHGEFRVKLGPTTASYRGTIRIESSDAAAHTATLAARGSDKRGNGGAAATIVNTLHAVEGGTRVDAITDFTITGRLASFGRGGMIDDISNRLLRDFAGCLQQRLAAEPSGGMTASEAAASAGAGDAIGKTPAEVSGESPAEVSGKSPAEVSGKSPAEVSGKSPAEVSGKSPAEVGGGAPPRPAPAPPAAAPPAKGFSLVLSVLWERIVGFLRRLFRRA